MQSGNYFLVQSVNVMLGVLQEEDRKRKEAEDARLKQEEEDMRKMEEELKKLEEEEKQLAERRYEISSVFFFNFIFPRYCNSPPICPVIFAITCDSSLVWLNAI